MWSILRQIVLGGNGRKLSPIELDLLADAQDGRLHESSWLHDYEAALYFRLRDEGLIVMEPDKLPDGTVVSGFGFWQIGPAFSDVHRHQLNRFIEANRGGDGRRITRQQRCATERALRRSTIAVSIKSRWAIVYAVKRRGRLLLSAPGGAILDRVTEDGESIPGSIEVTFDEIHAVLDPLLAAVDLALVNQAASQLGILHSCSERWELLDWNAHCKVRVVHQLKLLG